MTDILPAATTLRDLIDRAAQECGSAVFVIDPSSERTLTYGDLQTLARVVTRRVQERGVSAAAKVGVAVENGAAAVMTHLGLMYGGYVSVPINLGAPEQIAYVIEHSDVELIFAGRDCLARLETCLAHTRRPQILAVDSRDLVTPANGAFMLGDVRGGDDAVLMYTSGTTAHPKGVIVSQSAMIARGRHDALSQELRPDDRLLCVLPLHHMNALGALLGVLYSRGSMVMPRQFAVAEYWDLAIRYGCTRLSAVPTILSQLVAWSHVDPTALRGIRYMRCSSMPLAPALLRAFEERFGLLVIEGMGMTEMGGIFLNPPSRERRKIGSLGVAPICEVRIAGADGSDLPPGEVGEILVRGPALMTGYYKDPEATRSAVDMEGWLHTGDLGSSDEEGYFFHRGRAKELIIKAGTNISPLAIDEALLSHPKVAEAAAVGIPDAHLGEDIAAFVVLKRGMKLDLDNLVAYCAARVGAFRAPRTVVVVDSLPKGPTGKVLRHELAARLPPRSGLSSEAKPRSAAGGVPRTAVESTIALVWSAALGCEQVSTAANFFALGGNSMLALKVLAQLRERLGTHLSLSAFFEAPTVAGLAALVEQERMQGPGTQLTDDPKAILLAPVDSNCTATPLFCAYGVFRHRRLAECLGPQQPVYGLLAEREVDIVRGISAPISVEDLAREYVIAVRRVQPTGPYQLVGYSFGGRVAVEMAQQLQAAGETVALVVAVDTFMPGALRRRPLRWLAFHLRNSVRRGPRHLAGLARRRWRGAGVATGDEPTDLLEREAAYRARSRARYRPRPYDGKILLFRACGRDLPDRYYAEPFLGWGRLARGELVVEDVHGRHMDLMRIPAVNEIAARLRPHLLVGERAPRVSGV